MKNDAKILAANGAWSLANQLVRVGALALVMIALSRHFGPERFGSLVFGLSFVRIFAVIAGCGLDRIIVRQLAENEREAESILRTAFRLKLLIALVSYTVLLALAACIESHNSPLFAIAFLAGGGLLFQPCDVFDYSFQAQNRFRLTFLGRTLPTLLGTILKLGAIVAGASVLAFAALETVEMALIAATLFLVYRRYGGGLAKGTGSQARAFPMLREGLPLLLGTFAAMLYMRSDVFLLGRLAGYRAAGLYAAAAQVTEGCALLPMAFLPALLPLLVRWRRIGEGFYRRQFEKLFLATFLAGAAVTLCLTSLAPLIIRTLYGAAYVSAGPLLAIHAWSAVFLFFSIIQIGYEVTSGLAWLTAARTAAGAIVNIVLNCILIPRYGAAGSAVATVVSLAGSGFFFNLLHPASRPIFWLQLKALLLLPALSSRMSGRGDGGNPAMSPILMVKE